MPARTLLWRLAAPQGAACTRTAVCLQKPTPFKELPLTTSSDHNSLPVLPSLLGLVVVMVFAVGMLLQLPH